MTKEEGNELYIKELEYKMFDLEQIVGVLKRWCIVNSILLLVIVGLMIFD